MKQIDWHERLLSTVIVLLLAGALVAAGFAFLWLWGME
jgi:hypothetical protein